MDKELSYWLALAHVPQMKTKRKNELIVRLFQQGLSIIDFFELTPADWKKGYDLSEKEIELLSEATEELSNYAFMVEDLLEQGYHLLPITSKDYSPTLKKNLGRSYAPPLLYAKGNLQIMQEQSIAIVGSRKANNTSLAFTDKVAKKASEEYKVVVSGFAKGVDKQALDSSLSYKGQSIIVLPQGISTFRSGFKKYYQQIVGGDVLVLSTFYPEAPWSVQLAMARNPIIYGLAAEIYVAESSEKGGTWSGVVDGMRKGRTIYVRKPHPQEKNANGLLIAKGAKAVDDEGNPSDFTPTENEKVSAKIELNATEKKILELLKGSTYDSKGIIEKLDLDWSVKKLTSFLRERDEIATIEGTPLTFTHKDRVDSSQATLF